MICGYCLHYYLEAAFENLLIWKKYPKKYFFKPYKILCVSMMRKKTD